MIGGEKWWKRRGQESIAAANKCTVSTIRSASTVHRGLKVWEVKGQQGEEEKRRQIKSNQIITEKHETTQCFAQKQHYGWQTARQAVRLEMTTCKKEQGNLGCCQTLTHEDYTLIYCVITRQLRTFRGNTFQAPTHSDWLTLIFPK